MLKLFDHRCTGCGLVSEELVPSETREIPCPSCRAPAHRIASPIRCKLEGISGDFPGEALRWAKRHEREAKKSRGDNTF